MASPELAGCHEAAVIAGVSRQRFWSLRQAGLVPEPLAELACGAIWDAAVIRDWAARRVTAPGRPGES